MKERRIELVNEQCCSQMSEGLINIIAIPLPEEVEIYVPKDAIGPVLTQLEVLV